jgi:hypothetical protein
MASGSALPLESQPEAQGIQDHGNDRRADDPRIASGNLARIGARLIDGVAKRKVDDFFSAFSREIGAPTRASSAETARVSESPAGAAPLWWVVAILAAMFLLAYCT